MSWKERSSPPGGRAVWRRIALAAAVLAGAALLSCEGRGQTGLAPAPSAETSDGYTGSQACSRCHQEIYRQFSQTSMGRSMSLATPAVLENRSASASYTSERLNRRFEVYSRDGKLYQSESGIV